MKSQGQVDQETLRPPNLSRRHLLAGAGVLAAVLARQTVVASEQVDGNRTLMERVLVEMRVTRNFLASWFAGRIKKPNHPQDFYLSRVLAEDFMIVRPNGIRLDRRQTLEGFFNRLYGSDPKVLSHENVNIVSILDRGPVVVAGYDEQHVYADHMEVNALTAVFLEDESAPNGVSWLVVHETPIAE